ncbi:MAG: hypothetical protein KGL39_45705 [Patescibacteria group bacterium]|nr:hypothetical protein [Patescibacteria group bacterium]
MKFTNRFNLPQPFVDLVAGTNEKYDNGGSDFTTTGLLKPPRIVALNRQHWHEIEEDISECTWRAMGQIRHTVLETIAKKNPERYIVERRFFMEIEGVKISGQIDLYDKTESVLYDWKETSVWKAIIGDSDDWEKQANTNLFLMKKAGIEPTALKNIGFLKDWKKSDAKNKPDYPQCPIQVFPLKIWHPAETEKFIRERIKLHLAARTGNHSACTAEERWERPTVYAIMKEGRKSAVKLHEREENANLHLQSCDKRHFIQKRPGISIRCTDYCAVNKFCDFYNQTIKPGIKSEETEVTTSELHATQEA